MAIQWDKVAKKISSLVDGIKLLKQEYAKQAIERSDESRPKLVYQGRKNLLKDRLIYTLSSNQDADRYYIHVDLKKHAFKEPSIFVEYISPREGTVSILKKDLTTIKEAVDCAVAHFNKRFNKVGAER